MGALDKLWSIVGSKRLKTDQLLPVYIVQTIIRRSIGRPGTDIRCKQNK